MEYVEFLKGKEYKEILYTEKEVLKEWSNIIILQGMPLELFNAESIGDSEITIYEVNKNDTENFTVILKDQNILKAINATPLIELDVKDETAIICKKDFLIVTETYKERFPTIHFIFYDNLQKSPEILTSEKAFELKRVRDLLYGT